MKNPRQHTSATHVADFVTDQLPEPRSALILACVLELTDMMGPAFGGSTPPGSATAPPRTASTSTSKESVEAVRPPMEETASDDGLKQGVLRQDHLVKRRMLGAGPTASESADEQTGARLLPAEHLSSTGNNQEDVQPGPGEGARKSARRLLGSGGAEAISSASGATPDPAVTR